MSDSMQMPADAAEPNEGGALPLVAAIRTLLRISSVDRLPDGSARIALEDGSFARVGPGWMEENQPYVGGYLADSAFGESDPGGQQWFVPSPQHRFEVVRFEVAKLSLSPDDVLVVKLPDSVPMDGAQKVHQELRKLLPEGARVAIFIGDVELSVLAKTPEKTTYTFEAFVQYGIDNGGNIVNGMPWSFQFNGCSVTHETDECYLIMAPGGDLRFTRGQSLIVTDHGMAVWDLPKAPA